MTNERAFPVQEIFSSIQGEARNSGVPCTFIRLFGCNMHCAYCDSGYATNEMVKRIPRTTMGIRAVLDKVDSFPNELVCITGGEPLIHEGVYDLVAMLVYEGYRVEIETNGSIPILDTLDRIATFGGSADKVRYIMDVKTPCSKEDLVDRPETLVNLMKRTSPLDDIVFVISDKDDYDLASVLIGNKVDTCVARGETPPTFYLSPVSLVAGQVDLSESKLAHTYTPLWLIEDQLPNTRIQVQLHKYLGMP